MMFDLSFGSKLIERMLFTVSQPVSSIVMDAVTRQKQPCLGCFQASYASGSWQ